MPERTSYAAGEPAWTDLTTDDVEAAATFYATLFGWQAEPIPGAGAGGYTMLTLNARQVAALAPKQAPDDGAARWSVYLAAEDLERSLDAARTAGGTVLMPPTDIFDTGRMAVLADPAGAVVSLWEAGSHPGAGVVDEPGALTWVELASGDVAAAAEFYPAVFGWGVKGTADDEYLEFTLGGKSVGGLMANAAELADAPSYWVPYFQADPDRLAAEAVALGGTLVTAPDDVPGDGGRFAVVADPQGAVFGLYRPA